MAPWWSSALKGGGVGCRRVPRRRRAYLRRTAARVFVDLVGEGFWREIGLGVRTRWMPGYYVQVHGGGGALTGVNGAGARGGGSWPEPGKKSLSGLFQRLVVV